MNENIDHTGSRTEFADDPLNIQRHASNEKTRVFDTLNTTNVVGITIAQNVFLNVFLITIYKQYSFNLFMMH